MKQFLALLTILALTGMTSEDLGNMVRPNDRVFAQRAYQGGYSEVYVARQVLNLTNDPSVHKFATRMIQDHSRNDAQLAGIARGMHVSVQQKPDADALQEVRTLKHLPKDQIAEQYLTYEETDHERDLNGFKNEAQEGTSTQLRQYAKSSLPVLKTHLKLAQDLLHAH
ncbi:MAG: DUF4142 domain-containing protein [Vulcanimicrobiaceae bacterium]